MLQLDWQTIFVAGSTLSIQLQSVSRLQAAVRSQRTGGTFDDLLNECPEAMVDCPLFAKGECKVSDCTGSVVRKDLMFKHLSGNNNKPPKSTSNKTSRTVRIVTPPLEQQLSPKQLSQQALDAICPTLPRTYVYFQRGFNVMWFSDGSCYAGEWLLGKKSGQGTYTFSCGGVYRGQWLNDLRHGHGEQFKKGGASYVGMWQSGMRCGQGVETEINGNTYTGDFQNDRPHGIGVYQDRIQGHCFGGEHVCGRRHGKGTLFHFDGRAENVTYHEGERVMAEELEEL
eukprot:gene33916-41834_t